MMSYSLFLRIFLTGLFIVNYPPLHAQQATMQITGTVVDAKSKKPLPRASVYLDQTTKNTFTTDSGKFILSVPSGNYTLVISHIGYNSVSVPVSEQYNPQFKIELDPMEKLLNEVVITPDPNWTEYYGLFKSFFLGIAGKECRIQNPKALSFDYNDTSYVLTAEVSEPLIIDNPALGYRVHYDLSSFVHYVGRTSYSGHSRFEEMEPKNSKELKKWKSNREQAYYGSFMHFMRSLVNNGLEKDGFMVKKLVKANTSPSNIPVLKRWQGNESKTRDTIVTMRWNGRDYAPVDTALVPDSNGPYRWGEQSGYNILHPGRVPYDKIISPTASEGNYRLSFKNSLFITYTKKKVKEDFWGYGDEYRPSFITSILTMLVPETFVDLHGNLADPNAVINEGYWARHRVATQLPFDYDPE